VGLGGGKELKKKKKKKKKKGDILVLKHPKGRGKTVVHQKTKK